VPQTRSHDPQDDIAGILPTVDVRIVMDVGAHVGETVAHYRHWHPEAEVWACEPVTASYEKLAARFADDALVRCRQIALGAREYEGLITAKGASPKNRLVNKERGEVERVVVLDGDSFCERHAIEHVGMLKVDTEGTDLDVLRGFNAMLTDQRIDVLQVEAGMSVFNPKHVPFEEFKAYLSPLGYHLFAIYGQLGTPSLMRCDLVFISRSVYDAHK